MTAHLITLALAGQAECFATLMDRHIVVVKRRIYSMVRNAHDADDLLQEVQLTVWRRLSTFRFESSFRTWIIRVAINEVLQLYRREKRRSVCQPLSDLDFLPARDDSPHQCLARIETAETVRRAVAKLPSKYRQVLILRDLHELGQRETARFLELSVPAVKSRLLRARLKLLPVLRQSGNQGPVSAAAENTPQPRIRKCFAVIANLNSPDESRGACLELDEGARGIPYDRCADTREN